MDRARRSEDEVIKRISLSKVEDVTKDVRSSEIIYNENVCKIGQTHQKNVQNDYREKE